MWTVGKCYEDGTILPDDICFVFSEWFSSLPFTASHYMWIFHCDSETVEDMHVHVIELNVGKSSDVKMQISDLVNCYT
jgi:hypothetical protein